MSTAFNLPIVAYRAVEGRIMFPGISYSMDVGRPKTITAIAHAEKHSNRVLVAFQKDPSIADPGSSDLCDVAVEATLTKTQKLPKGSIRAYFSIQRRMNLHEVKENGGMLVGTAEPMPESESHQLIPIELAKTVLNLQSRALDLDTTVTFRPLPIPANMADLSRITDAIASSIGISLKERLWLLRCVYPSKRAQQLGVFISRLEAEAAEKATKEEAEAEKAKTAAKIVPKKSAPKKQESEADLVARALDDAGLPDEARRVADEELARFRSMSPNAADYSVQLSFLKCLAALPWSSLSDDHLDIMGAREILDRDHYALDEAKERILEFLAVRKLAPEEQGGMILCFAGPPGVGKTSLGRSIAEATGRKFIRLSLGGVRDEAEIRGHRRTYVGALPGRIMQEIRRAGTRNPVFMLDEVDKLGRDFRGDPSDALLEVLDPAQNHSFVDNYISTGFNLSDVMFVVTANDLSAIPGPLRDRMDVVEIPGYSSYDKVRIAKRHIVPKQLKRTGLPAETLFGDKALARIVNSYTQEAGVRELERKVGAICRKIARCIAGGEQAPPEVDAPMVREFLKHPIVRPDKPMEVPSCGVSTGMAWNPYGGSILMIETILVPGKGGEISMTGRLGEVLQESVKASMVWIKAHADELGISEKLEKNAVHVHLPAGAVPKDGPSAGTAITTALVSAFTGIPVRHDVAMTGEMSLRGRVLPVGGIPSKVLAARRAGIRDIILPEDSAYALDDLPQEVANEMTFHKVGDITEVLELALTRSIAPDRESGQGDQKMEAESFGEVVMEASNEQTTA